MRCRSLYGCTRRLGDLRKTVHLRSLDLIKTHDPDLILLPYADTWVPQWSAKQEGMAGATFIELVGLNRWIQVRLDYA